MEGPHDSSRGEVFAPPISRAPPSGFSPPRTDRGTNLTRSLNEPLPPMRSPPLRESPGTREANSVESLSFAAPPSRSEAPRPSESKFAPLSSRNNDFVSTPQRSFSDSVMCSTSRATIEAALEGFRVEAHSVPDFVQSTNDSVQAVQEAFKSPESWQGTQQDLWSVWSQITWLTQLARVPTFPIDPDKVALLLSVYVDLPCSKIVRELIRHRQTLLGPDQVLLLLQGLHLAGKASRTYWPHSTSLVRNYSHYPSITLLVSLLSHKIPRAAPPPSNGFAPPKPPPASRSISRPPLSNFYGSKPVAPAPAPALRLHDTFTARPSLNELCKRLPAILRDLKNLPDDPQVFDIAQLRFQNASAAPAYVPRMPDLVKAAVLYTNITALLCFPTYPIDAVKLAVFALSFTPGPLGQRLIESSQEFANQRQYSRMSGLEMEKLMKDVTAVRDITRGGAMAIPEVEMVDWSNWSKELAIDWFSVASSRSKPSQNGGPPKKRIKLSPSPTNSEVARESAKSVTSRPVLTTNQPESAAPSDRSTPGPSTAASISSPEVPTKPLPKGKAKKGKKATAATKKEPKAPRKEATTASIASSSRSSTPSSTTFAAISTSSVSRLEPAPRWKPRIHGVVPDIIPIPPVPPIRPSGRWLRLNQIKDDGTSSAVVEELDEDEDNGEAPRTIAASRPKRRGGMQMIPVDVEALWTLARNVGYTEDAMDEFLRSSTPSSQI